MSVETFEPVDRHDRRLAQGAEGLLGTANAAGRIGAADVHVATALARAAGETDDRALLAAALAVRALRSGSVALDLTALPDPAVGWPAAQDWVRLVAGSRLATEGAVVVEHGLVYLQRYHHQEVQVREDLRRRVSQPPPPVDEVALAAGLRRVFPDDGYAEQRAAAAAAVRSWTTVLTGGPGTGKTTTVAGVLALLAEQSDEARPLRVGLAAPTGKAAARMQEAVTEALELILRRTGDGPGRDRVAALREVRAVTLHRLLGSRPDSGTRFRHHRGNRLPHDVVLVDEASMISLTHMARLLEALRPTTRLVLVGDPDQLVSVDAGAVLGDLVAGAEQHHPGQEPPLTVARLRTVHRFGHVIGGLAQALRDGDADGVVAALRAGSEEVQWREEADPVPVLRPLLTRHALAVHRAARVGDGDSALAQLGRHRLLCAHREGPHGVGTWNRRVEQWVREESGDGLYDPMYVGRPLLVTANDYATGVFNGDTGVVVATTSPEGRAGRAALVRGSAGDRVLAPSRLGEVETLHAMTIHKAQGSQAEEVTVLLPEEDSRLLTRELLYTAVTRAQRRVRVVGSEAVVRAAVERRVSRASGLRARLGPPPRG